jgi:cation diffusion facilitator CzcD-associated flavoprotein CzcO
MIERTSKQPDCDVVVVGAGFAGIYALWQARQRGLSVRGFESAPDVGGTWYWNAYPGARCDVPSYNYAYFFDSEIVRNWNWSDICAYQGEIQHYLRHVAERCDILRDIAFDTKVSRASYSAETALWTLSTSSGETVVCRYLVLAIGALSEPKVPDIDGAHDFAGETYFTSKWPKDRAVDFAGKRVGVIGTGSSGVQVIPEIAKTAERVFVFQRTANYVIPTEGGPIDSKHMSSLRQDPQAVRQALRETYGGNQPLGIGEHRFGELDETGREEALRKAWDGRYPALAFRDAHLPEANAAISDHIRKRMQAIVEDPLDRAPPHAVGSPLWRQAPLPQRCLPADVQRAPCPADPARGNANPRDRPAWRRYERRDDRARTTWVPWSMASPTCSCRRARCRRPSCRTWRPWRSNRSTSSSTRSSGSSSTVGPAFTRSANRRNDGGRRRCTMPADDRALSPPRAGIRARTSPASRACSWSIAAASRNTTTLASPNCARAFRVTHSNAKPADGQPG